MDKASEVEILNISKLLWDAQGIGWLPTASQGHIQM